MWEVAYSLPLLTWNVHASGVCVPKEHHLIYSLIVQESPAVVFIEVESDTFTNIGFVYYVVHFDVAHVYRGKITDSQRPIVVWALRDPPDANIFLAKVW